MNHVTTEWGKSRVVSQELHNFWKFAYFAKLASTFGAGDKVLQNVVECLDDTSQCHDCICWKQKQKWQYMRKSLSLPRWYAYQDSGHHREQSDLSSDFNYVIEVALKIGDQSTSVTRKAWTDRSSFSSLGSTEFLHNRIPWIGPFFRRTHWRSRCRNSFPVRFQLIGPCGFSSWLLCKAARHCLGGLHCNLARRGVQFSNIKTRIGRACHVRSRALDMAACPASSWPHPPTRSCCRDLTKRRISQSKHRNPPISSHSRISPFALLALFSSAAAGALSVAFRAYDCICTFFSGFFWCLQTTGFLF